VKKFFKPELVNRIDSIIVFNPIDAKMMKQIVEIQLKYVAERLKKQNLNFQLTDALKKYLADIGYDEVYGARPLKRLINELIVDEIALQIIEGKIKSGDQLLADYKQNKPQISVKKPN